MAKTRTLYNEYRPHTFEDVVGQEVPVQTMVNAIASGKIAGAYLFSGPRGTGKTTTARIFAQAILCLDDEREGVNGCGQCDSCREFEGGVSPDFIELDAATNRGIENIRTLKEQVYLAPRTATRKIVLIDEVHHLTSEAATGLLKILEEPPSNVVFMLATTDPQKIPATIRSRCQWLRFKPLEIRQIETRLSYVLGAEGRSAEDGVTRLVAAKADGGMRDGLSMLDMLITYCGDRKITMADAQTCFENISHALVSELANYISENQISSVIGFTSRHRDEELNPKNLLLALLDVFALAIIIDNCGDDAAVALEGASQADITAAKKLIANFGMANIVLSSNTIERAIWKFDSSAFDSHHVFNETMLAVMVPELSPRHLELDETSRNILSDLCTKNESISKAVKVLIDLQKKSMTKK